MAWLVSSLGALLVAAALRDLFHTLWHPTRRGGFSRVVMAGTWRLAHLRHAPRTLAHLAGPTAMVLVVVLWAVTVVLGWALVYLPHVPHGFTFASGLEPEAHDSFVDALYLSLVMVATLGLGDISPADSWLRIVAPLEAMVGFALLTASVSWVLETYPALTRRRALALRLATLRRTRPLPDRQPGEVGATLLDSIAADVAHVRVDFAQHPESYYFFDGEESLCLARSMDYAQQLASAARQDPNRFTRHSGETLGAALADLAAVLDTRFLHTGAEPHQVFEAYRRDHDRYDTRRKRRWPRADA